MPSDSGEKRPTKAHQAGAPPAEPEHLPCPRCDSTNTKFCYYNNYNFSQPRHFCKACRRYWTHGGALRDIPVGGGSRRNAKRCRTSIYAQDNSHFLTNGNPISLPLSADHGGAVPFAPDVRPGLNVCGSFTSLLSCAGPPGVLSLGGFGLGIGPGFEKMGIGFGGAVWPFPVAGDGGAASGGGGGGGGVAGVNGNTWQPETGEFGFLGEGCFSFPDLAISTPGNGTK